MYPKTERIFKISRDNRGLVCPFKLIVCEEGYCYQCQTYRDWEGQGEKVVVCILCGGVVRRTPFGRSVFAYGLCNECEQKSSVGTA